MGAVDPQDLWALPVTSPDLPYRLELSWASPGRRVASRWCCNEPAATGEIASLLPQPESSSRPLSDYTNNPLRGQFARRIAPELRRFPQGAPAGLHGAVVLRSARRAAVLSERQGGPSQAAGAGRRAYGFQSEPGGAAHRHRAEAAGDLAGASGCRPHRHPRRLLRARRAFAAGDAGGVAGAGVVGRGGAAAHLLRRSDRRRSGERGGISAPGRLGSRSADRAGAPGGRPARSPSLRNVCGSSTAWKTGRRPTTSRPLSGWKAGWMWPPCAGAWTSCCGATRACAPPSRRSTARPCRLSSRRRPSRSRSSTCGGFPRRCETRRRGSWRSARRSVRSTWRAGRWVRGLLMRLGEREHAVLFTFHHIVFDAGRRASSSVSCRRSTGSACGLAGLAAAAPQPSSMPTSRLAAAVAARRGPGAAARLLAAAGWRESPRSACRPTGRCRSSPRRPRAIARSSSRRLWRSGCGGSATAAAPPVHDPPRRLPGAAPPLYGAGGRTPSARPSPTATAARWRA